MRTKEDWLRSVGERFARLRWRSKLTADALGKRIHLQPQTIESFESGECDLDLVTFWKLSEMLGASPGEIVDQPSMEDNEITDEERLYYEWLGSLTESRQQVVWRRTQVIALRHRLVSKRKELQRLRTALAANLETCAEICKNLRAMKYFKSADNVQNAVN